MEGGHFLLGSSDQQTGALGCRKGVPDPFNGFERSAIGGEIERRHAHPTGNRHVEATRVQPRQDRHLSRECGEVLYLVALVRGRARVEPVEVVEARIDRRPRSLAERGLGCVGSPRPKRIRDPLRKHRVVHLRIGQRADHIRRQLDLPRKQSAEGCCIEFLNGADQRLLVAVLAGGVEVLPHQRLLFVAGRVPLQHLGGEFQLLRRQQFAALEFSPLPQLRPVLQVAQFVEVVAPAVDPLLQRRPLPEEDVVRQLQTAFVANQAFRLQIDEERPFRVADAVPHHAPFRDLP